MFDVHSIYDADCRVLKAKAACKELSRLVAFCLWKYVTVLYYLRLKILLLLHILSRIYVLHFYQQTSLFFNLQCVMYTSVLGYMLVGIHTYKYVSCINYINHNLLIIIDANIMINIIDTRLGDTIQSLGDSNRFPLLLTCNQDSFKLSL